MAWFNHFINTNHQFYHFPNRVVNVLQSNIVRPSMIGWYEADYGFSSSQWLDKSGRNYHLLQPTLAKQPALVNSVVNGLPVVRFTGVEWMQAIYGTTYNAPFTIFIVTKSNSPTLGTLIDSYNNYSYFYYQAPSPYNRTGLGGITQVPEIRDTTPLINTKFVLNTLIANGVNSSISENSLLKVSGNAGTLKYNGLTVGQVIF